MAYAIPDEGRGVARFDAGPTAGSRRTAPGLSGPLHLPRTAPGHVGRLKTWLAVVFSTMLAGQGSTGAPARTVQPVQPSGRTFAEAPATRPTMWSQLPLVSPTTPLAPGERDVQIASDGASTPLRDVEIPSDLAHVSIVELDKDSADSRDGGWRSLSIRVNEQGIPVAGVLKVFPANPDAAINHLGPARSLALGDSDAENAELWAKIAAAQQQQDGASLPAANGSAVATGQLSNADQQLAQPAPAPSADLGITGP